MYVESFGIKIDTVIFCTLNIDFNFSDHKPILVSIEIQILAGVTSSVIAEDIFMGSLKRGSENVDWKAYETSVCLKLQDIVNEVKGE